MKTSSNYWQKRFRAVEEMNNKTARKTVQNITPAFDQAQAQIEKEINAWYTRFANNNQISLQEAKRLLNTKELKEFRWDVEKYIEMGEKNALDSRWMKELENASARYHISRLEALKVRTQNAAELAFGNQLDELDQMAARIYTDDYYHTAYEIQRGLGIGWDIGQIDERRLKNVLSTPWTADKLTFSDRIWKSKSQLIDNLQTELTQMCIMGTDPQDVIDRLAKRMQVSKGQAGRLVMTESAYFGSAAQKDCFTDLEVEFYEIIATLDNKTSEVCQQMDGKVFKMSDFQIGVTAPPFHVWCRTCTAPWFEDFAEDDTRAARGKDGKTYQVPASMKYDEWKKTFVDGGSKDGLAPVVNIDDLRKLLGDKQTNFNGIEQQIADTTKDRTAFQKGEKIYEKYIPMSDDEYKKYLRDLDAKEAKISKEIERNSKDLDRWYDRPERYTPEYDEWKRWKDTVDINQLNADAGRLYSEKSKILSEKRLLKDFDDWNIRFKGKSASYYADRLDDLNKTRNALQKEIDDLTKQIDDAIKQQSEVAFNAKTLAEFKESVLKKHESILKMDVQKKELSDILDGMDKKRANLYDKLSENFSRNSYYMKHKGFYSPAERKIKMDMNDFPWDKKAGRNVNGAWKTKFHEEMHQLDHILGNTKSPFALIDGMADQYATMEFTAIRTVTGKRMIQAIDDDIVDLINKAVDWDVVENGSAAKAIKSLDRIPRDTKSAIIRYLKANYPTPKDRALIDTVTDAIGMTTSGKIHPYSEGFWGHSSTYCKNGGKNGATSEVWANLGSFFLRNDTEAIEAVRKLMPNTVSTYKDIFDEVTEYAKTADLMYK